MRTGSPRCSAGSVRPALSLRRLEVDHGKYDTAIVSPHDRVGFIADLVERNPTIEIRP
ncbi:MAG: PH domain-containing protein [Gemmatimonadota bacterium]